MLFPLKLICRIDAIFDPTMQGATGTGGVSTGSTNPSKAAGQNKKNARTKRALSY